MCDDNRVLDQSQSLQLEKSVGSPAGCGFLCVCVNQSHSRITSLILFHKGHQQ